MPMHAEFPNWYRDAGMQPSPAALESRWNSLENACKDLKPASIISLLANFYQGVPPEPTFAQSFENAVRVDNEHELRVLAGATLRVVMEDDAKLATLAALGLVAGGFDRVAPVRSHRVAAEAYLAAAGKRTHARSLKPVALKSQGLTAERFSELVPPQHFAPANLPQLPNELFSAISEATNAPTAMVKQLAVALEQIRHVVAAQDEELNVLWWLFNAYSTTLDSEFAKLGDASVVVLPVELGKLVGVPGPTAASATLIRAMHAALAGDDARQITIVQATNSVPRTHREALNLTAVPSLCPVLFAVARSLDTDEDDTWLPVYRKACDVRADASYPALALATQVFREHQLLVALNTAK